MKKIASLSVVAYAKADKKLFDYVIENDTSVQIGSLCVVEFGKQMSLAVVRDIGSPTEPVDVYKPIVRVIDISPLPASSLELADWLIDYYVASCRSAWQTILPTGIEQKLRQKSDSQDQPNLSTTLRSLTQDQAKALAEIQSDPRPSLLFGVTGSGKTEIYIHLIDHYLRQKHQSVIMLIPEIVLTPQMIDRLSVYFADRLVLTHSALKPSQRKRAWLECLNASTAKLVVGPRSALFMPVRDLGLIIIDEEHESSYKQEQAPRYHANFVAGQLASSHRAKLVLGSATPSLQSYWLAQQGRLQLVKLSKRAGDVALPQVSIHDLRQDHNLLNRGFINRLKSHLASGHQAILFINRRGSAQALLCQTCGHAIRCPNCETSLAFHADNARLNCHYCNYSQFPPAVCPHCQSTALQYIGTGTKGIETSISELFAEQTIARLDRDNSDLAQIEATYQRLRDNQIDILIGTQMVARGLDIDNVEFVGVILADSSLNIPDFSAGERTFQLVTQVVGRAGRKSSAGEAIIQTYLPDHPSITAAAKHDYEAFYEYELNLRARYNYPPFCYLARLTFSHHNPKLALAHSQALLEQFTDLPITALGPVKSYRPQRVGKTSYHIIVKAKNRAILVKIARQLKTGWTIELDPITLI